MVQNNTISNLVKQILEQQGINIKDLGPGIQDIVGEFVKSLFEDSTVGEGSPANNNGFAMQLPEGVGELVVDLDENGVLYITISNNESISSTLRIKGVDALWLVEMASNIHKLSK